MERRREPGDAQPRSGAPRAVFLWSERYRTRSYGSNHPLAIPRVALTFDLIASYGAFAPGELIGARRATAKELDWFHDRGYVQAFATAETEQRIDASCREKYCLGTLENPYFRDFFTLPATAAGASIQAAELLLDGQIAFNPAGGMHHARRGAARGFCYLNDPVLAIVRLRREALRVLYVDIDAHHGDGVEAAFRDDPEVLTLSLHMDTGYAYPHAAGRFEDQGSRASGFTTVNVPLPQGVHDAEYEIVFDAAWYPALERFGPDAVVLQAGADTLFLDPLARLCLTTQGFLAVAAKVLRSAPRHANGVPRLLVTGGGGYHLPGVARAWAGLWGLLSGRELPGAIPAAGQEAMRATGWTLDEDACYFPSLFQSRLDVPSDAPIRPEILDLARQLASHRLFRGG
jgi:acetoin utilization protein AcuC